MMMTIGLVVGGFVLGVMLAALVACVIIGALYREVANMVDDYMNAATPRSHANFPRVTGIRFLHAND